jgi:hypothetical protein
MLRARAIRANIGADAPALQRNIFGPNVGSCFQIDGSPEWLVAEFARPIASNANRAIEHHRALRASERLCFLGRSDQCGGSSYLCAHPEACRKIAAPWQQPSR